MFSGLKQTTIINFLSAVILLFSAFTTLAQSNKKADDLLMEAKKQLSVKNYKNSIKTCNQILSGDPMFKDAHLVLADVYSSMDSVNLEIYHLNRAGEIGREWDVVFRLGEAYYKKGDYSEALRYYNIYSDYKYIPEKRQFLLACKIASCNFLIHSSGNTDEYWPLISDNGKKLLFVRQSVDNRQDSGNKIKGVIPDSVIWNIEKTRNDSILFDNERIQNLSKDSKIVFFTACNRESGMGDCDIYFVKFENGKWGMPMNAGSPVNTGASEAQPSFWPEKRILYFSSNRNGGKGNRDIWRTELLGFDDNGIPQWKTPANLTGGVNTSGEETSPFYNGAKGNLYFVSDGHPGLGGKDLFEAAMDEAGNVKHVKNLGYPINTTFDDDDLTFSYICDTTYFSSSRRTERGQEIYAFNFDRGVVFSPIAYVKTKILDAKTKKPVQTSVKLEFQPFKPERFQMQETAENGETMFCLQLNRNYAFSVSEPGYMFTSKFLNLNKVNSIEKPVYLEIELQPIEIGAEVQLYNIYFETDSFRILPQSDLELQKVAAFLKNNSSLKIEVQGHTDSSGNAEYNLHLSERRAKSVVDYLLGKGIKTSSLKYKGYGDKNPISSNETPEGRMLNRRTTIKIIEK